MASKLQKISELANQTAHAVTRNVDGWKSYLTTAARRYKYDFEIGTSGGLFLYWSEKNCGLGSLKVDGRFVNRFFIWAECHATSLFVCSIIVLYQKTEQIVLTTAIKSTIITLFHLLRREGDEI